MESCGWSVFDENCLDRTEALEVLEAFTSSLFSKKLLRSFSSSSLLRKLLRSCACEKVFHGEIFNDPIVKTLDGKGPSVVHA